MTEGSNGEASTDLTADEKLAALTEGTAKFDPLFEAILAARSRILTAKIHNRYMVPEESATTGDTGAEEQV